jgi:hypothetical protein
MALRPAPKRTSVDYQKLDDLQKEIFGSEQGDGEVPLVSEVESQASAKTRSQTKESRIAKPVAEQTFDDKTNSKPAAKENMTKDSLSLQSGQSGAAKERLINSDTGDSLENGLGDMETIAARIASSKAGQGRNTTRPFSLPRTLIIDTTRLKAKFRTIDEQFTQNVIIDFLLREALAAATPENYKDLRASAFEIVKRAEETTRRSLTVTEDVVYQMSELKAGINLETGKKYSNDEIFSTLLALGVSWLYRNGVLS